MSTNKIILVGGFHEVIELCELCDKNIVGIIDEKLKGKYLGYEIFGGDNTAPDVYKNFKDIPVVITPDSPKTRSSLVEYYSKIGFEFTNIISPNSTISKSTQIGNGVIIQSGVNVSSLVTIGDFVKLNSYSNIMHDSVIRDYVTVAPNAVILGRVEINNYAYIGSNATILPEIIIGKNSVVGAGAVVTKGVVNGSIVVGNPARKMEGR